MFYVKEGCTGADFHITQTPHYGSIDEPANKCLESRFGTALDRFPIL